MIQTKVLITPLVISKAGQVKHFQIKLPKTAVRVIGVELGSRFMSTINTNTNNNTTTNTGNNTNTNNQTVPAGTQIQAPAFKRNMVIGELKLQSCEEANIFYAGQIQSDSNLGYQDFTQNAFWKVNPFTHQIKTFEETVIVEAKSTIIQGVYKDRIGEQQQSNINYLVNLYLWYENN